MATSKSASQGTTTTVVKESLLDEAISATKQTSSDRTEQLLRTLTSEALKGTVSYNRNLSVTINNAIKKIDELLSTQVAEIMHNEDFRKLEGSWRGLRYLVYNSETSANLKIRVLNVSKRELSRDLSKAVEFDQSKIFKTIYESEFGIAGGEPFGALVGDYEFGNSFEDIEALQNMSSVAAAAFAPFIAAAGPTLFGFDDFTELSKPRDLEKIFQTKEYIKWRSFRESSDSRFVTLTMPRVLTRLPFGPETLTIDEFDYNEAIKFGDKAMDHNNYCWSNASYILGSRLTDAFAKNGWCTAIRGAENGGKVESCRFTFSRAMTAIRIQNARPKSASQIVVMRNWANSASCHSAITRIPIMLSSSVRRQRISPQSMTGQKQPRMLQYRHVCLT